MKRSSSRERLEKELAELERELRVELPQEIQKAVALGDLRENAEYKAALERQQYVQARIAQTRAKLQELSLLRLDTIPHGKVGFGSKIGVVDLDTDEEITYELVMNDEAKPEIGLLPMGSPIARGFIGKEVGDEIDVRVPSGRKRFEILSLETIHDREGEA